MAAANYGAERLSAGTKIPECFCRTLIAGATRIRAASVLTVSQAGGWRGFESSMHHFDVGAGAGGVADDRNGCGCCRASPLQGACLRGSSLLRAVQHCRDAAGSVALSLPSHPRVRDLASRGLVPCIACRAQMCGGLDCRRDSVDRAGWEILFVPVDDHAKLACTAMLPDEKQQQAVRFLRNAVDHCGQLDSPP